MGLGVEPELLRNTIGEAYGNTALNILIARQFQSLVSLLNWGRYSSNLLLAQAHDSLQFWKA